MDKDTPRNGRSPVVSDKLLAELALRRQDLDRSIAAHPAGRRLKKGTEMVNYDIGTLEMAQTLGDSYLEGFDIVIEMHDGAQVTGKVTNLLNAGVQLQLTGEGTFTVVRLDSVKAVTRV